MRLFQLSIFFLWVNFSSFILDFGHLCSNYYWLEIFLILLIFIRKQLLVSLIFWIIFFFYISLTSKLLSCVQLSVTPWTAAPQASLSFSISQNLLKLMSIELMIPFNHLILFCPLLLLPSIFLNIRIFSNELALRIRWSKYWIFSFSISPSNEYSGLVSFRIEWFEFLAVQGTLQSLLQHHRSKPSIIQHSAFFMVRLLHLYLTTGKTIPWLYDLNFLNSEF